MVAWGMRACIKTVAYCNPVWMLNLEKKHSKTNISKHEQTIVKAPTVIARPWASWPCGTSRLPEIMRYSYCISTGAWECKNLMQCIHGKSWAIDCSRYVNKISNPFVHLSKRETRIQGASVPTRSTTNPSRTKSSHMCKTTKTTNSWEDNMQATCNHCRANASHRKNTLHVRGQWRFLECATCESHSYCRFLWYSNTHDLLSVDIQPKFCVPVWYRLKCQKQKQKCTASIPRALPAPSSLWPTGSVRTNAIILTMTFGNVFTQTRITVVQRSLGPVTGHSGPSPCAFLPNTYLFIYIYITYTYIYIYILPNTYLYIYIYHIHI